MRFTLSGRTRRVALAGTAAVTLVGFAACDYFPDGDPDVLAVVGSDTTQDVVGALVTNYNDDPEYNEDDNIPGVDKDSLDNVLSVEANPNPVAGDEHCAARTYHTPAGAGETLAPNGSTAGRDALKESVLAGDGCIDIARSSSGPRAVGTGAGQDPASFEYYAFGLDAVGWSSASAAAPANMTLAQLRGVYNCTFTNWNQVGGTNQAIQRFYPQPGSGTRAFFQSDVLGFDPFTFSSATCPLPIEVQENQGATIPVAQRPAAIVPYSGANWIAMANGVILDQRAGQTIRNLNGQTIRRNTATGWVPNTPTASNPNAPVQEANVRLVDSTPAYPGIRFVFNVIDNTSPSYQSAIRYVGFDNVTDGSTSPLCSNGKAAILTQFGFGPLTGAADPVRNVPGTRCRLY
jgi:phosphate transport system substrate-binding protein